MTTEQERIEQLLQWVDDLRAENEELKKEITKLRNAATVVLDEFEKKVTNKRKESDMKFKYVCGCKQVTILTGMLSYRYCPRCCMPVNHEKVTPVVVEETDRDPLESRVGIEPT